MVVYKLQDRQPKSRKSSCNISSNSGSGSESSDATYAESSSLTVPISRSNGSFSSFSSSPGAATCSPGSLIDKEFVLVSIRKMAEPVISLQVADLLSDGMNEIIVLSRKGLHILQVFLKLLPFISILINVILTVIFAYSLFEILLFILGYLFSIAVFSKLCF